MPVRIATGPNGLQVPLVRVSVGGGAPVSVILDTGSIGLAVRSDAVGSAAHTTTRPFQRQYGGFALRGHLDTASVSLLGGTGSLVTPAMSVAAVNALTTFQQAVGAAGILGVASGQGDLTEPAIVSPLAELPGSLADGYLIDVRAGRLQLGMPSVAGAVRVPLTKASWTYPNGLAGYVKYIRANWTIGGQQSTRATLFDTGGRAGSYPRGFVAPNVVDGMSLRAGTAVQLALDGHTVWRYTAGSGLTTHPIVTPQSGGYMNTGLPAFDAARIGVDQRAGQVVVAPY